MLTITAHTPSIHTDRVNNCEVMHPNVNISYALMTTNKGQSHLNWCQATDFNILLKIDYRLKQKSVIERTERIDALVKVCPYLV